MQEANLESLVAALPKAELHLHIEGTLEPAMMMELAQRNGVKLPYSTMEEAKAAYNFGNLQEFLDLYYLGAGALVKQQDFFDLTFAYFTKANENNVKHAEIMFDPQTHTDRGIAFETVFLGIEGACTKAKEVYGITSSLIMSFLRHLSEEAAFATLEQAKPFLSRIKSVGLDSGEVGNPPEKFSRVYAKCRDLGLIPVAHAGEEGSVDPYMTGALDDLKVQRIDHGVRCVDSPDMMARLIESRMPLTVCPNSNQCLKVFKTPEENNTMKLHRMGLNVTINSDDPAYFHGYINDNFMLLVKYHNATMDEIVQLCKNSFNSSFISDEQKAAFCEQVDKAKAEWFDRAHQQK